MANQALRALGTSVFAEMTALAERHGAVNLSQGFPDFEGPSFVKDAALAALSSGKNQYGRSRGVLPLVAAIAAHDEKHRGLRYDPATEIVATAGATEAIAATFLGLLNPRDEVILLEPFYDSYPACAAMAGAVVKVATLRFPEMRLPLEEIRALTSDKTRLLVLNTPHNPSGRVFSRDELEALAAHCVAHDLVVLCDEVYEHLVYDDHVHVSLSTLPGMRERTLRVSSTGKTFSFTGWKVGFACGPAHLVDAVQAAHQFLTFSAATPLHHAMGAALSQADDGFYAELRRDYTARRDLLLQILREAGFGVAVPAGAYFVLADLRPVTGDDDVTFARRLVVEAGVAAIPPSAFYSRDRDEGRRLLRFAFCKQTATLERAGERLRAWRRAGGS